MTHSTDASVSKTVRSPRIRPTFFHSADRGLHVPTRLTRRPTKHEGLQPRASVRPRVGCCEELASRHSRNACDSAALLYAQNTCSARRVELIFRIFLGITIGLPC